MFWVVAVKQPMAPHVQNTVPLLNEAALTTTARTEIELQTWFWIAVDDFEVSKFDWKRSHGVHFDIFLECSSWQFVLMLSDFGVSCVLVLAVLAVQNTLLELLIDFPF